MWGIRNLSGLLNKTQLSFPGWLWREKVRGEVLTKPLALTLPAFPPFTCPSGSAREFALSLLRCLGRRTRRSSVLFPLWGWGLCQIPFSVSSGLTHSGVKHTEESWRLWGHRLGSSEAENAVDNLCSTQLAWSSEPHTGPSRPCTCSFLCPGPTSPFVWLCCFHSLDLTMGITSLCLSRPWLGLSL